jgi:hypothetical protein
MKQIFLIAGLLFLINGCEKGKEIQDNKYVAKIVGFDTDCATYIVNFPDDSLAIVKILGESRNNFYRCVNLDKGEFDIGQMIKIKIRQAETFELKPCIQSDPSSGLKSIYVSDYEYLRDFEFNDTIDLPHGHCLNDYQNESSVCFDKVVTDSRCPVNVVCVWAGEAIAGFTFRSGNNIPVSVDLQTGTKDTVINGYNFSFPDLLPYPQTEHQVQPADYIARIIIKKE